MVRIFPMFSHIPAEYGEMRSNSPYSVLMRKNAGKMRTRITRNTDSFYAVISHEINRDKLCFTKKVLLVLERHSFMFLEKRS